MKLFLRLTALMTVAVFMVTASGCCCTGFLPGGGAVDFGNLFSKDCEHVWTPATCEAPDTCHLCGATEGDPLPHTYVGTTCSVCGLKLEVITDPTADGYYCIPLTGEYGTDISLPMLENAKVSVMMSIDWTYLSANNDPEDPFAQLHAHKLWFEAYGPMGGSVDIVTISDEQQTEYLATQSASGTAPDIVPANYDLAYPRWSAAGLTDSVEKYADHLGLDEEGLYNRALMNELFLYGGESHAAITTNEVDRNYIVYNKTKFEQAGQSTPLDLWEDGKWNWTTFVKTAKAMTDIKNDEYGFTGWGLFPYFAPYPMVSVDDMTGKVSLTVEDNRYMRYMTEVYHLYQADKAARADWSLQNWSSIFPAGTDAMVMTTKAGFKQIKNQAARLNGDEFGIAPVPAFDPTGETVGISSASVWGYSITAAAENPIGAAEYIRLEALVTRNIEKAFEGNTWYDKNLTDAEKDMLEATADDPVCVDMIRGIGDCYFGIVDAYIVPEIYYMHTKTPVQQIFDKQLSALKAEVSDYNAAIE